MATAGYFWVEGKYLCYIDGDGNKRGDMGSVVYGTPTAGGYLWIQVSNIYYTDAYNVVRWMNYYTTVGGSGTAGGYLWLDGNWIYYTASSNAILRWHADTAHQDINHSDYTHTDTHSNTAHSEVAHVDVPAHDDTGGEHSDYPVCFLTGTKISMANNSSKKVEDIETGDRVLSFYNKNKLTSASVSKLFSHLADHYYLLKTENHEVNVTGEHPFYIGEGFKRIKEFSIGDKIYILENGKLVPEKIVHKELIKKQVKIYNFKVEESQTYFANGFAVHNKPPESDWDDWINTPHSDTTHSDVPYADSHADSHSDTHSDWNNGIHSNYYDESIGHSNYNDTSGHSNLHGDTTTPHSNIAHLNFSHIDQPGLL
jgi:hypothetical protein